MPRPGPFRKATPGRPQSPGQTNEVNRHVHDLAKSSPPIGIQYGGAPSIPTPNTGGMCQVPTEQQKFWVKITGGSNPYTWLRLVEGTEFIGSQPVNLGTMIEDPEGRSGDNARARFGATNVPVGARVELELSDSKLFYWFNEVDAVVIGGEDGTGGLDEGVFPGGTSIEDIIEDELEEALPGFSGASLLGTSTFQVQVAERSGKIIPFDTVEWEVDGAYVPGTAIDNRLYAPVNGWYHVGANITWLSPSLGHNVEYMAVWVYIRKNGNDDILGDSDKRHDLPSTETAVPFSMNPAGKVHLEAGDYIEAWWAMDNGNDGSTQLGTDVIDQETQGAPWRFWMYRLGTDNGSSGGGGGGGGFSGDAGDLTGTLNPDRIATGSLPGDKIQPGTLPFSALESGAFGNFEIDEGTW